MASCPLDVTPGGNELVPIGKDSFTRGTREQAGSPHVLDENPTHFHFRQAKLL